MISIQKQASSPSPTAAPRIAPLEAPYEAAVDTLLRQMMPRDQPPIALFRTFARNVAMTEAMGGWGRYELGPALSLTLRQRELVIDRVCARCGCEYEWGVHVAAFGERAGLTDAEVASLAHGDAGDACWADPAERVLIEVVDALHDTSDVPDELWSAAARHFDERQLLDLLLLTGWYHAISFCARAARVTPEGWAPRFADYRRRR